MSIRESLFGPKKIHKRIIFVGTRGSAKTTALGCLSLTCDLKSLSDKNFVAFIDEKTSGGIRQVPSDLCQGKFPPATIAGNIYEADMVMSWQGVFGKKTVILPFAETAGEDMEKLIGPYHKDLYRRQATFQEAKGLTDYICNSHGYVLVAPVSRALMFDGKGIEKEPDSLLPDPDVNLARILASIYRYKRESRSPKIEGIAVLLTKYDMIDVFVKARGMDFYHEDGMRRFLHTYFRQTSSLLKYYGLEKVRFFPVHVQVERIEKKDGSVQFTNNILTDPHRNLPLYSEQSYLNLIDWIKETFAP
jgi:hypothetical protein